MLLQVCLTVNARARRLRRTFVQGTCHNLVASPPLLCTASTVSQLISTKERCRQATVGAKRNTKLTEVATAAYGKSNREPRVMASPSLSSLSVFREVYRDWTLYVRWYSSWGFSSEGWVCKLIPPGTQNVSDAIGSLGRYPSRDAALDAGRRAVNQRINQKVNATK